MSSGKVEEQAHGWLVTSSIAGCPSPRRAGSGLATAAVLVVALFAAGVWVEEGPLKHRPSELCPSDARCRFCLPLAVPNGINHSPPTLNGAPSPPQRFSNGPSSSSSSSLTNQQLPATCGARQLSKLKRFLTTLQQFGNDISPEIGEKVRTLVLALVVSPAHPPGPPRSCQTTLVAGPGSQHVPLLHNIICLPLYSRAVG